MTSKDALRVAVVGYGLGGRVFHVPFLLAAGFELSHVVTANPERVAQAREAVPGARILESPEAPLAHVERPQLAVLASSSGTHAEQAHAVIDAVLADLVDKPLATSERGAREVVEHAERAGVPVTVPNNRRWDDEERTLQ